MKKLRMLLLICTIFGFAQPAYAGDDQGSIKKCVALTFDDGPDRVLTPQLLSILRDANVRATFYLVGVRVSRWPEIVREMQNDGHEIGNHSWNHPNLTKLSPKNIEMQIEQTDRILIEITGAAPRTIRPPYGAIHSWMRQMLHRPLVFVGRGYP